VASTQRVATAGVGACAVAKEGAALRTVDFAATFLLLAEARGAAVALVSAAVVGAEAGCVAVAAAFVATFAQLLLQQRRSFLPFSRYFFCYRDRLRTGQWYRRRRLGRRLVRADEVTHPGYTISRQRRPLKMP